MPVAAAAANTPLLRVCRNVVVFLLEDLGKPAFARRPTSGGRPSLGVACPTPSSTRSTGIGCAGSPGWPAPVAGGARRPSGDDDAVEVTVREGPPSTPVRFRDLSSRFVAGASSVVAAAGC